MSKRRFDSDDPYDVVRWLDAPRRRQRLVLLTLICAALVLAVLLAACGGA